MPISEMCSKNVITVEGQSTVQSAARQMRENNVGAILVIESNGKSGMKLKPVGMITDRDIALAVAESADLSIVRVSDLMSENISTITEMEGVADAARQMSLEEVRRLVVVDKNGEACGIISADDLYLLLGSELSDLGYLIEKQIRRFPKDDMTNEKNISHYVT